MNDIRDKPNITGLEIGSFEGMSARWLLDNIFTDPTSRLTCADIFEVWPGYYAEGELLALFEKNMGEHRSRVTVHQGRTDAVLPQLRVSEQMYDFIYIDGSHLAPDVLDDLVLSWKMLKPNGIMIFDDYGCAHLGVGKAVEVWKLCHDNGEWTLVHTGYQHVLRKN